ncbi:MAG: hypothetical protein ACI9F9_000350 [Candidatus Paceibacteria bacterium]|jgi:hypothetical protein
MTHLRSRFQNPRVRASLLAPAATLLFAAFACNSGGMTHESNRAATQRDAGSVHVAVLSVAPWSQYVDAMQPNFQLTADEALAAVIQDSRQSASMEQSGFGFSANLVEDGEVEKPAKSGKSTTKVDQTGMNVPFSNTDSMDPLLRYQAANSLYQEVQLLNRAVADAAIAEGCRAYMVRLQLSLLPRSRHEPYDAYATLSFFTPEVATPDSGSDVKTRAIPTSNDPLAHNLRALDLSAAGSGRRGPSVLPLLVTDNLEATLKSRVSKSSSRLSLGMLSYLGTFAADIGADIYQRGVEADIQARDMNGLLTVARLSENSLRVRLGAMQEATADYAMVPRNHNITLLLMVPEELQGGIDLVGRVNFIDAETGEELPGTSEARLQGLLRDVATANGVGSLDQQDLRALVGLAQVNDQPGFFGALSKMEDSETGEQASAYSLWVDMVSLLAGSQYFSSHFDLPQHGEQVTLSDSFFEQTALAIDDGEYTTLVDLYGADLNPDLRADAMLVFYVDGQEIRLPSRSMSYEGTAGVLSFGFPSLRALRFGDAAAEGLEVQIMAEDQSGSLNALYVEMVTDKE